LLVLTNFLQQSFSNPGLFQARQIIHENLAIEMVYFMLDADGQQF
jgi:hypothetical protein